MPSCAHRDSIFALSASNRARWRVPDLDALTQPPPQKELSAHSGLSQSVSHSSQSQLMKQGSLGSGRESSKSGESSRPVHHRQTSAELYSYQPQLHSLSSMSRSEEPLVEEKATQANEPERVQQELNNEQNHRQEKKWLGNECFPIGYCWETEYESGWLDLGCGPTLTIDINYYGRNSDPTRNEQGVLVPSLVTVEVEAPVTYIRVFGLLAKDLLALKVSNAHAHT